MEIMITPQTLDFYLELNTVFTEQEYLEILRPDIKLLHDFPQHPKFGNSKFWGPCKDKSGKIIHHGYKMKWHNMGPGKIQLRLLIVIANELAYLCKAYVKHNENTDFREMAKLKTNIQQINEGRAAFRGGLL